MSLIVPSISIYEVFKRVYPQRGEDDALRAVTVMMHGSVVDLDATVAFSAAKTSLDLKLPMADSIMLATALESGATLWTPAAGFKNIADVRYVEKRGGNAGTDL